MIEHITVRYFVSVILSISQKILSVSKIQLYAKYVFDYKTRERKLVKSKI
jgi:hypothetical protein